MSNRKKAPEDLAKHLARVFRHEFSSLNWGKFWTDLIAGSGLAFIGLLISLGFSLSIKQDWDEHPIVVVILAVLPASVLMADLLWRIGKVVKTIYRERAHASFRDAVHVFVALILGWCFIGVLCGWIYYESLPHFHGKVGIIQSFESPYMQPPFECLVFRDVRITNTGVPAVLTDSVLHVHTQDGGTFTGLQNIVFPPHTASYPDVSMLDFLFNKIGKRPVRHMETVTGWLSFVVIGLRHSAIIPGTKYEIELEDSFGKKSTISGVFQSGGEDD
jgi:hypothetical protein